MATLLSATRAAVCPAGQTAGEYFRDDAVDPLHIVELAMSAERTSWRRLVPKCVRRIDRWLS
ncbi:MAG: hypothetical protein IT182_18185 [Acidobacteria bacterium]|nr:hypothetical protein [Acidobacteriota bacterium]